MKYESETGTFKVETEEGEVVVNVTPTGVSILKSGINQGPLL
jgi:hypothetical protein